MMSESPQAPARSADHWRKVARQFSLLGSPLRPCEDDTKLVADLLSRKGDSTGAPMRRAWLLGVTPEIAGSSALAEVELVAVERVPAMIEALWPGDTALHHVVCADWLCAPFPDASFDCVIGDGCLTAAAHPAEAAGLLESVHRCLRDDGLLLLRLFCRPEITESPEQVVAALRNGKIGSFHAFKWRFAMAVQGAAATVCVGDVWRAWEGAGIDPLALSAETGMSRETIETIEVYRGGSAHYAFMPFDEAVDSIQRHGFRLLATGHGAYELAERCPHVLLRKI